MMRRSLGLVLVSLPFVGCSPGIEAAPEGYHHEWVNNGKRSELVTVADRSSSEKPVTMLVRANPDKPDPADYYIYITEGKQVSRILVHNQELGPDSNHQWIEVAPDHVCPNCKPFYKLAGKQMVRSFYCDATVHVEPGPRRSM